jgi:hypothetical protein
VNLRGRPFTIAFERDENSPNFKAFPLGEGIGLREATDWLAEHLPRTAEDAEAGYFKVTHGHAVKLISLLMESPASEGETIR